MIGLDRDTRGPKMHNKSGSLNRDRQIEAEEGVSKPQILLGRSQTTGGQ